MTEIRLARQCDSLCDGMAINCRYSEVIEAADSSAGLATHNILQLAARCVLLADSLRTEITFHETPTDE